MNAKEQIIRLLKREIAYFKASDFDTTELYSIIAATEQAIFDVPSEDVCMKEAESWGLCLGAAMNMHTFILNYKKPESDGKAHLD